jgi:spore coat protein JB
MNKDQLSEKLYELKFAAVDLNLYLDNHPDNKEAIDDYNTIVENLKKLTNLYEANYGPLTNFGCAESKECWSWVDNPWPWENM